jgi:hypothetical protein
MSRQIVTRSHISRKKKEKGSVTNLHEFDSHLSPPPLIIHPIRHVTLVIPDVHLDDEFLVVIAHL